MAVSQVALSAMKFDAGFDIAVETFANSDQVFQEIIQLFEEQKLSKFMTTRIKLPVSEIKEWVYTISGDTEEQLTGKIAGTEISLSPARLTEIFGLVNGDDDIEIEDEEFDEALSLMGFSGENPNKLLKKNLSEEYKLLADIVGKVLLGKTSAHDYIPRHQFLVMVALVRKKKVNWGSILFDLIKRKLNKQTVCFGRILGIFLEESCPALLTTPKSFINASKKITSALFGKWERSIPRKASAPRSKGTTDASRTCTVTPPTLLEVPSTSTTPPAASHIPTPPPSPPSPHHSPIQYHSPTPSPTHSPSPPSPPVAAPSPPPQSPPHSHIPTPSQIPAQPSTSCPIHDIPSTSTSTPSPYLYLDLAQSADQLYDFILPKLSHLLDEKLTPIYHYLSLITSVITSTPSTTADPVTTSRGLDAEPPASRQGENANEVLQAPASSAEELYVEEEVMEIDPAPEHPPHAVISPAINIPQLLSLFDPLHIHQLPAPHQSLAIIPYTAPATAAQIQNIRESLQTSQTIEEILTPSTPASPAPVSPPQTHAITPVPISSPPSLPWNETPLTEEEYAHYLVADEEVEEERNIPSASPEKISVSEIIREIDELYDIPASSEEEEEEEEVSDESQATRKRKAKAKAKSKAKASSAPKKNPDADIPYYKLHGITPTADTPAWMLLSKNENKRRKKFRKTGCSDSPPKVHYPPPPPPPTGGSQGKLFPSKTTTSQPTRSISSQTSKQYVRKGSQPSKHTTTTYKFHVSDGRSHAKRNTQEHYPAMDQEHSEIDTMVDKETAEFSKTQIMARMAESRATSRIEQAKAKGLDYSNITTDSIYRRREFEKYDYKEMLNTDEYMRKYPAAVLPFLGSKTMLGAEDSTRSRRDEENPNRQIIFKPPSSKKS